ncbi:hypothetical protein ACFRMN_02480 [Streptomyces sp. NPDC056835]
MKHANAALTAIRYAPGHPQSALFFHVALGGRPSQKAATEGRSIPAVEPS